MQKLPVSFNLAASIKHVVELWSVSFTLQFALRRIFNISCLFEPLLFAK